MIYGVFRDGHPRVTLTLPTATGSLDVEFILDTGFEGGLTLPDRVARLLEGLPTGFRNRMLADGSLVRCPTYEVLLDSGDGEQLVGILGIEGRPLLGTEFLRERLVQIEMTDGGDVTAEPL